MRFQEENNETTKRRKKIWFNPSYSRRVKTNIAKNFLHLLVNHLQANNKMHKTFIKNTVKVSYSYMKNMDSVISRHNHNILNLNRKLFGCCCRKKYSCPLNGKCMNDQKSYFGLTKINFKDRYNNHKRDVKYIKYQYNTELTKYIWKLKNNSTKHKIQWNVVDRVYGNTNSTMCKLFDGKALDN